MSKRFFVYQKRFCVFSNDVSFHKTNNNAFSSQATFDSHTHQRSPFFSASPDTHSDTDPYYWDTGKAGERYTKEVLIPLSGFKHFDSNCYIPKPDGTLTVIDLILLHISGIYVIESKNYSGLIYGHEEEQK